MTADRGKLNTAANAFGTIGDAVFKLGALYIGWKVFEGVSGYLNKDNELASKYEVKDQVVIHMDEKEMGKQQVMIINGKDEPVNVTLHGNAYAVTGKHDAWILQNIEKKIPANEFIQVKWDWQKGKPCYPDYYSIYYKLWVNDQLVTEDTIENAFYHGWEFGCGREETPPEEEGPSEEEKKQRVPDSGILSIQNIQPRKDFYYKLKKIYGRNQTIKNRIYIDITYRNSGSATIRDISDVVALVGNNSIYNMKGQPLSYLRTGTRTITYKLDIPTKMEPGSYDITAAINGRPQGTTTRLRSDQFFENIVTVMEGSGD